MKNIKILSGLLAAAILMSSAVGCSSGSNSSAASGTAKSNGEKVEIEFFGIKAETQDLMGKLIKKFNSENKDNIVVKQTTTPDAKTVLFSRIASNDIPDVFGCLPTETNFKEMFKDGQVMDLTSQDFLKNVQDSTLKMVELDGKQYSLPLTLSAYGLYYRTDIFKKMNLTAPTTYKELIDDAQKIQASGINAFAMPNKDIGLLGQRMERMIGVINNDSNSEFQKIAKGQSSINDSKTLQTFMDSFCELNKYSSKDSMGMDQQAACAEFVNGKAAMMINGTWTLATLKQANPDIQCELIPLPNPSGEDTKVPVNIDSAYSISNSTKHPKEALEFMKFLAQTDVAQIFCDSEGSPNQIKGVKYNVKQHAKMVEVLNSGKDFLTPTAFWPSGLRDNLRTSAQQLLINNDKKSFLNNCNQLLKQFYKK